MDVTQGKGGVQLVDALQAFQGLGGLADADEVDAQVQQARHILAADLQGAGVGVGGLVEALQLVEGQAQAEQPFALLGAVIQGLAELVEGAFPLAGAEETLGSLGVTLGSVPFAHGGVRRLQWGRRESA